MEGPMARSRWLIGCAVSAAWLGICSPLHAQDDALHRAPTGGAAVAGGGPAPADGAARGQAIVEGKGGCQGCHRINAVGSRIGPDLSTIGSTLSAAAMTRTLTDPNAALRPAVFSIRAVTKDGRTMVGLRLNEDRYSVQFIDEQERLRSLNKSDLREFAVLKTARMPSFKDKLTAEEIADVVAYLRTLR
jgi:putative heme-binding domain-containing protein